MIQVEALSKSFQTGTGRQRRTVPALQSVSWQAADGAITGLLGPNGAGKTTTLRIVAALLPPEAGQVRVDGLDVARTPRAALARLGVLSDARGLYPRLTARENIVYYGRLQGLPLAEAAARAEQLARVLDLGPLLDRRTEGFSQGERMKTALARALVHNPPNIILDEPTNGLDVLATRSLREALRRLRDDEGKCIVFSTHIMQEVERLCDQVVVIAHGCTVAQGTVAELLLRTGQTDFEEAFVDLAFSAQERAAAHTANGEARP
ncbi:ATP-binding cassette domain-containing protein [Ideonella sp. B7]|uniref:ABC transporter ATP-binding protein n=1 Tax=Ideonella benzenivorans TaxID=2831643 RepID=UPI001CEDCF61|nr:ATP-binding cassette domain-containing protein [Ideonella benzenivorans]MCA6218376.1 ATP-binding cassette domain-containing protein [Ideonella benzenivorans]